MQLLISLSLLIAAFIHLMPLVGLLGADKLQSLYGVEINDPNLLILMQHRAVLFGIVGALLVLAVFKSDYRWLAIIVASISAVSFLFIAITSGGYNASVKTVVNADIVAILALASAAVAMVLAAR